MSIPFHFIIGGVTLGTNLAAILTASTSANSTSDQPEISLTDHTSGETEIQTLDITSNLPSTLAEGLTPLSTTGTYESVLNEPLMTVASTETVESKIDIVS